MTTARIELPPKLIPVFAGQARYRCAYGGRGSGKTRTFAKMAAVRGYQLSQEGKRGVIVCGREYMNSLDDSSMAEVKEAIASEPWLAANYEVGEKFIRTRDGRISFIFIGLRHNLDSIKSKARIHVLWVDEAEPVSETAWQKAVPTVREHGSEIWVTWNPEQKNSATHKRFRLNPPDDAKVVEINWRDNPWFPAVLEQERLEDQRKRPDEYDHIWEGAFATVTEGAILARLIAVGDREGRIGDHVGYDPNGPAIEISSDLGFRDTACWWFWQRRVGGFALLDYDGDSGLDAEEWIPRLKERLDERGWPLGKIWLPHDARTKTFASRHSPIEQFIKGFGESKCGIVPQTSKTDRINAARTVVKQCEFHASRCEDGLDGLRAWKYEWNDDTKTFSKEPAHDWASHPGDSYSYGCQMMTALSSAPAPDKRVIIEGPRGLVAMKRPPKPLTEMTYNEFHATTRQGPKQERV
ncbi:MAG: phage terminase large subunit [Alphaproteobacteria bacterium]